jgi:hypothetical protein
VNRAQFLHLIEEVDARLQAKGVPAHARPLHAFMDIAKDYDGPIIGASVDPDAFPEYEGPDLLRKIEDWYTIHYHSGTLFHPLAPSYEPLGFWLFCSAERNARGVTIGGCDRLSPVR